MVCIARRAKFRDNEDQACRRQGDIYHRKLADESPLLYAFGYEGKREGYQSPTQSPSYLLDLNEVVKTLAKSSTRQSKIAACFWGFQPQPRAQAQGRVLAEVEKSLVSKAVVAGYKNSHQATQEWGRGAEDHRLAAGQDATTPAPIKNKLGARLRPRKKGGARGD